MSKALRKYLDRRADLSTRPLVGPDWRDVDCVIVIPALAEEELLPRTLRSLAENERGQLERAYVICVVNNRARGQASEAAIEENARILALLRAGIASNHWGALRVGIIDASSPGFEFAPADGVGTARKLGMDWAAYILCETSGGPGVIASLDADTPVAENYVAALRGFSKMDNAWAAVIDYEHRIEEGQEASAIIDYETYLRAHVLGLRYARSPYAFHTIGSALACTPDAYAAVSGMRRRSGAEDFYFLQALAKTGTVRYLRDTKVYPSPRPSDRVPFGTGRFIRETLSGTAEPIAYHPAGYSLLRRWLEAVAAQPDADAETLAAQAEAIDPAIPAYLTETSFVRVWERIRAHSKSTDQLLRQFDRWFDAFRTVKFLNYLKRTRYPGVLAHVCGIGVLELLGEPWSVSIDSPEGRVRLLERLRAVERTYNPPPATSPMRLKSGR